MPVDREVYLSGDQIVVTINYCRYTDVTFTTSMSFSNNLIYELPSRKIIGAPRGCGIVNSVLAVVPDGLPPGRYKLVGKNEYPVNSLVTRVLNWETVEFGVME